VRLSSIAFVFLLVACTSVAPPAEVRPAAPVTEPASLTTATGAIHGTLLVPPSSGGRVPVTLIVAGSGPTDRDGNSAGLPGKNDSLEMLAEGLAANGIASLRYDKRGIGESGGAARSEGDLRFEHYVEDAAAWIRQLRADPRFSTITVIGHSEGSLIGMLAAMAAGADRFVTLAGPGRSAPEVLREQLRPQLPPELWEESERVLGRLVAGETVSDPPAALTMLYRPSVQPYLISWFRHDPSKAIATLEIPVLVVQGTTDIQVPVTDAHALHGAARAGELAIIDGMNHVLKMVDDDRARQIASYSDPSLPIAAELVDRIVGFIRAP
jgi:uncharacterized protein